MNAPNCCANCSHENTCGYSPLAMSKERTENSYTPCCLGMKSSGEPFYQPAETCPTHKRPLVYRKPSTPEQEFVGHQYACELCFHSVTIPSDGLKQQLAAMTANPQLPLGGKR